MRGRFRIPLYVVAVGLLGLIVLLATLQYQWLGRVSEAERDRLRASLSNGAAAFSRDFDGELTRAYLVFQNDPMAASDDQPSRIGASYDRWLATSQFPRLLKAVYTFEPSTQAPKKYDPQTRSLLPVDWPASMKEWRQHLVDSTSAQMGSSGDGSTLMIRRMASTIWDSVPAIVVPSPLMFLSGSPGHQQSRVEPSFTYTILELDEDYIARELLPALADQHFKRNGGEYQVAVVSRGDNGRVIYHSAEAFNPLLDAKVDAAADLYSVRTQDFTRMASEVHRLTTYAATLRFRNENEARASASPGTPEDKRPVQIVVEQRADTTGPRTVPPDTFTLPAMTRVMTTGPAWKLLLKHQAGSLEAAVDAGRRRNLIVSTSILAVLGASMALLLMATRKAQRLARQQTEFVATVSHELRTPLAVIRSAADNLADGIVEDAAQVKKYGELVRAEGRRLSDMVEQILEFSGIESAERRAAPVPVAVAPLLRDAIDRTIGLAETAGVNVELTVQDGLPPVMGDEPSLLRVVQNLLGNAVKYGADAKWIGVDARQQGSDVVIAVSDRGIGIDPAEHERIFEPFYRTAAVVDAQLQGAGLGLSLVQRIVRAHGGHVTVRSAPGEGAAFSVYLPAARPERAPERSGTAAEAPRYS